MDSRWSSRGFSPAGKEAIDSTSCLYPIRPHPYDDDVITGGALPDGGDRIADDVLEVDDDELEVEEARVAKTARDPLAPTQAEWTAHQATHLPFRSWCPECVAGRRDNPAHKKRVDEERMVPEVGKDYAFVRREEETERVTILVVKDRETRAIQASVMRHTMKPERERQSSSRTLVTTGSFQSRPITSQPSRIFVQRRSCIWTRASFQ